MQRYRGMQEPESDELAEFLTELAAQLLAHGIGVDQFTGAVESAYVNAAVRSARLRNSRVNQSAVAAITGLSRHQVRARLRVEPVSTVSRQSRMQRILSAWRSDPEFLDSEGRPRVLQISGKRGTFASLAKKYASDVSHPALLTELARTNLVQFEKAKVRVLDPSEAAVKQDPLKVLVAGLAHAIRSINPESEGGVRVYVGEAEYASPIAGGRLLMERRIAQACRALAADIKSAGDALGAGEGAGTDCSGVAKAKILIVTSE